MVKYEKKFRAGLVTATVWLNESTREDGSKFDSYSIQLERSYQDKDQNWKTTSSFGVNDMAKINALVNKVYEFIVVSEDISKEAGR